MSDRRYSLQYAHDKLQRRIGIRWAATGWYGFLNALTSIRASRTRLVAFRARFVIEARFTAATQQSPVCGLPCVDRQTSLTNIRLLQCCDSFGL